MYTNRSLDPKIIADRYHSVDPETGFLSTNGDYANAFTPERKKQFLALYKKNGLRFRKTCKDLGLGIDTINHHMSIDPAFKEAFASVSREYAEKLEAAQRQFAMEKKCFMDRAMQLRALFPEKYGIRNESANSGKPTIVIEGNVIIDAKKRVESIEAEVLDEVKRLRSSNESVGNLGDKVDKDEQKQ